MFLRWLNGWKLLAIGLAVGYVAFSTNEIVQLNRLYNACSSLPRNFSPTGTETNWLAAIAIVGVALVIVGTIWVLVSLFVRVERGRD